MSEPKKKPCTTSAEVDGLLLEIQRLEVDILVASADLTNKKERIEKLRRERDELGGGQSLFMMEDDK